MSKTPTRFYLYGLSALVLVAAAVQPIFAINIRHDVADALYQAHGAQLPFDATVFLVVPSTDVTGTIIGDGTWLLTAAHAVDGTVTPAQVSFSKNAVTYTGTQIVLHPGWTGNSLHGTDLALVKLNAPVAGVVPATIYTGNSELTQVGSLVGYGRTGTGHTGDVGSQGTLRGAQNVIDAFVTPSGTITITDGANARTLFADFDAPAGYLDLENRDPPSATGSSNPQSLEGTLNTGDSGSPLFIEVLPGVWQVAGVGAAIFTEEGLFGAGNPHIDLRFGDYGDASLWTRVSTSSEFILSTIPEPSSGALAITGVGFGAWLRRRRRRF